MKICIYGSSSENTPEKYTTAGYELGLRIAENKHILVFGGGSYGMMGAVASGVYDGEGMTIAVAPDWIWGDKSEFENCSAYIRPDTISDRKTFFKEISDVFIVCPGGIGTLDELFDTLGTKYLDRFDRTIILFNIDHYFDNLISMLEAMCEENTIEKENLYIYDIATTVDEIFNILDGLD